MTDVLAPLGYTATGSAEGADMVILNTCHIREKASEKVFSELGRLRMMKERARDQEGREVAIAVAGCVAQAEGEEITRRAPWVDIVVGPQTYHRLPELVSRIDPGARRRAVDTEFPEEVKFDQLPASMRRAGRPPSCRFRRDATSSAPLRGALHTWRGIFAPGGGILEEARRLVASGTCELTLLGQNVNAYHGEAPDGSVWSLARLIRELAEIDGLARIRYTTSHPLDMEDDLIAAHRDVPA